MRKLCVCIPCFNETWEEMEETLLSLEENLGLLHNMAKRQVHVQCTMVIIQDGVGKAHPSMTQALAKVFGEKCLPPERPVETQEKWTYISEVMAPVSSVMQYFYEARRVHSPIVYRMVLVCKGENRRKHNR